MNKLCKFSPYFLFVIFLFIACKSGSKQSDLSKDEFVQISLPYHIELEDILKKKGTELLSQVASEISYVPLETHANSLVNRVGQVCYWNENIIVGEFRKLHLFDKTGHFIQNISRQGGGPGEFERVNFVVPDPDNGNLYLFDRRTLLKFDRDIKFLEKYQLEGVALFNRGFLTENKTLLFHIPNDVLIEGDTTTLNSLVELDTLGNVLKFYKNEYPRYKRSGISIFFGTVPLYNYKNNIRLLELGSDTLFTILEDGKDPYAVIKLGDKKIDYSVSYNSFEEGDRIIGGLVESKLHINNILEDEHFIYLLVSHGLGDNYIYCTFNKFNGDLFMHENNGLLNDLDGGLSFFPKWVDEATGDKIMIKPADEFKEEILALNYDQQKAKYGDRFQQVYDLANTLQEDDNPILILVR